MSDMGLTAEDFDDYEDDGDWRDYDDPDYERDPDPEDHEIAEAYAEYAKHCETVHGGGECTCRPTLRDRISSRVADLQCRVSNARWQAAAAMRGIYTVRIGRAEFTLRLNANRACGACSGRGWSYGLDRSKPDDRPPGYNTVGLCGCGSAITSLAAMRAYLRSTRNEPPF